VLGRRSTNHGVDGETMSTLHRQGPGGDAVGRLLGSAWRYKGLLAVAVLVGALFGYGWAARQPTVYESVSRVRMAFRCPDLCSGSLQGRAQQLVRSPVVLERAVMLSGGRVSAEALPQRLEVDVAQEATEDAYETTSYTEVVAITIRAVDSTAKGAAQLANALSLASRQVMTEQEDAAARRGVAALARRQRQLQDELDGLDQQLAAEPRNTRLQANREAKLQELNSFEGVRRIIAMSRVKVWAEQAALPAELVQPRPLSAAAIGGLLGLAVGAGLAWWRSRPSRTLTMAAGEER
jgi:uncharacterized protein involved in exopolysaccharide biosynthesis